MICSLALGTIYYGEGTKEGLRNWKDVKKMRETDFGTSLIGDDADREFVGERYHLDTEKAWAVRQGKKKKGWGAFWTVFGIGLIRHACQDDDDDGAGPVIPGDFGGDNGGPGGR
jgi:hypothetical protein